MRITGRITAWFPERGYGYITARNGNRTSRFFLHISKVVGLDESLEEPVVGCVASFEPTNDFKRHPKDIPSAIDVEVDPTPGVDPAVLQILSGNGGVE
jgi:cold shock CspA family protein